MFSIGSAYLFTRLITSAHDAVTLIARGFNAVPSAWPSVGIMSPGRHGDMANVLSTNKRSPPR